MKGKLYEKLEYILNKLNIPKPKDVAKSLTGSGQTIKYIELFNGNYNMTGELDKTVLIYKDVEFEFHKVDQDDIITYNIYK